MPSGFAQPSGKAIKLKTCKISGDVTSVIFAANQVMRDWSFEGGLTKPVSSRAPGGNVPVSILCPSWTNGLGSWRKGGGSYNCICPPHPLLWEALCCPKGEAAPTQRVTDLPDSQGAALGLPTLLGERISSEAFVPLVFIGGR